MREDLVTILPGQDLMLGRLEIESLRAEAEARLGADFDIRSFHRAVLGNGAIPLLHPPMVGAGVAGRKLTTGGR